MIPVDTSVWIDHLREGDEGMTALAGSTARLWTRDKRLAAVAAGLALAFDEPR